MVDITKMDLRARVVCPMTGRPQAWTEKIRSWSFDIAKQDAYEAMIGCSSSFRIQIFQYGTGLVIASAPNVRGSQWTLHVSLD